jgi:hypothetical protein
MTFDLDELRKELAREVALEVTRALRDDIGAASPWMSTAEAIAYSALPPGTFRKRAASGEIPSHGGKTKIFHRAELDRALGYVPGKHLADVPGANGRHDRSR